MDPVKTWLARLALQALRSVDPEEIAARDCTMQYFRIQGESSAGDTTKNLTGDPATGPHLLVS
jgi:hypothetical protein